MIQSSSMLLAHEGCMIETDLNICRTYPRLTLRLRAPIEVQNLLPYNVRYKIYDKNMERYWNSYLRKGGTSPLHISDLTHLLLLSVEIQDSRECS